MGEDQKPAEAQKPEAQQIPEHITSLAIIWDRKKGSVQVVGNALADKITCYGLLECAKDAIKDMQERAIREAAAKKPAGGIIDFARGLKH